MSRMNPKAGLVAALAFTVSAGACKTVSPDDLDASLAALRADMQAEMSAADDRLAQDAANRFASMDERFISLERALQSMEEEFEVAIAQLEDELRFDVPVYFGFDDHTLGSDDEAVLARFAGVAQKYYPSALVTVEGFTDAAGNADYNMWLGEQRAKAVAEYLVANSRLTEDDVRAVSYGEDSRRLVNSGWGNDAGWENRRVVLVIDHNGMLPAMTTDSSGD